MSTYIHYPASGSGTGVATYANVAALPASAADGTVAVTLDTDNLYVFNSGSSTWKLVGGPTIVGVASVSNSDSTLTISPTTGAVVASLNLAHANTWTAAQSINPSSTSANGLNLKPPASSTGKIFNVQNSSSVSSFYVDGHASLVFHVSDAMRFHNIPAGSILALDGSNYIRGIASLTNINYNYGANTLTAVPSGTTGAYQFQNASGLFDGNTSHALIDVSGDNHSEFFGNTATISNASGFTPNYIYGTNPLAAFNLGYTSTGQTIWYQLYTKKNILGSPIYSLIYSSATPTIPLQTITLPIPQNLTNSGAVTGSGSYINQTIFYQIAAFAQYNNNVVYSGLSNTANASDFSSTPFYVDGINTDPVPFPPNYQSISYRLLRSLDSGVTYDAYKDVSSLPVSDDGTGWTSIAVDGVSAYEIAGSGYTETGATRDYQVYALWNDVGAGVTVYTFLGAYSQAGFTDNNMGGTYDAQISWNSFTFPAGATGEGYVILRSVNSSGFNEYVYPGNTSSFTDSGDFWWTAGAPVTPKWNGLGASSIPNFFQVNFTWTNVTGNSGYKMLRSLDSGSTWDATDISTDSTAFTDTGNLPWSGSTTVTPTSAGPFGAKLGTQSDGLQTTGSINVNGAYRLPTDDPGSGNNYVPIRTTSSSDMTWTTFTFSALGGTVANSQLPFGTGSNGSLLFSQGGSLYTSSNGTLDYGNLFQTLRTPTVLASGQGLMLGNNPNSAHWQNYGQNWQGSSNTSWLLYNLQGGAYGPHLVLDGDRSNLYLSDTAITTRQDNSSVLQVDSTTRGLLGPRGTTTQKNAISSPAEGLQFYDSTLHALCVYNGSSWITLGAGGGTGTVTSVALSVPATSIFGVTGSPVTTSGTLGLTTTGTSGGIPYFSSSSQLASSAALTANQLVIGGGAGAAPSVISAGSSGQVLQSAGASAPAWSTATFPSTATGTGTFLRADGTNWVASTLTLPNTTTANQILYSSSTSVVGQITTANTSALVTNSSGVPSFTSGGTANRVLRTDGSAITFAQVAAATDISGQLPLANGGTAANLSATNGGLVYSGSSALAITAAGTTDQTILSTGAGAPIWYTSQSAASFSNFGLAVSVSANAMTIALKQADGSTDPASGAGAVKIAFRSSTATTGSFSVVSATGATSITIPSGASLGHTSGVDQYVWVYAINNSGTIELAVSGVNVFQDKSIQSSTSISSGSTSGSVLYSTTGRTSKAIRLIGRLLVNESAAGTWASNTTDIVLAPTPVYNATEWISYTPTFTNFGTVTSINFVSRRNGGDLLIQGIATTGTTSASIGTITIGFNGTSAPSGVNIGVVPAVASGVYSCVGYLAANTNANDFPVLVSSSDNLMRLGLTGTPSSGVSAVNASNIANSSPFSMNARIPIAGWSAYGP